jgi:hypothetical protein
MTETNRPNLVPASLVRIRCFLNRRGMKVKPWLGPDAVLEAFYAAVRAQCQNDAFWDELEVLLGDLARDMNQRVEARGWVIQNELLNAAEHAELLGLIRQALSANNQPVDSIHPLVGALPRRAGALLMMLAAAIVIGCGGETVGDATPASGGAVTTASGGATSTSNPSGGTGVGGAMTTIKIDPAGGAPPVSCSGANSGLDPANFAACNQELVAALIPHDIHTDSGQQLLQCACLLNDAWQSGLASLFAGQQCYQITNYLGDCGLDRFCGTDPSQLPEQFDQNLLYDRCFVPVYLGVRAD